MLPRRSLLAAGLLAAHAVRAQDFPSRSLRLLVPFAPIGAADSFARLIVPALGFGLRQRITIENMGGGATRVATSAVVRAAPDGHTLLVTTDALAALEALPQAGRPPLLAGLAPVMLCASAPMVMVTHPRSGLSSAAGFAQRLRGGPPMNIGVPGLGSTPHFVSAMLCQALGAQPRHTAFRGVPALLAELQAGNLDAGMMVLGAAMEGMREGRIIGLGVTSAGRARIAPELPSFGATLAPGFVAETWIGIFAPAATPAPVLARLSQESLTALREPSVMQPLNSQGFETPGLPAEPFAALLRETITRYAAIAAVIGLRGEELSPI